MMRALEFETQIHDGVIVLPQPYKQLSVNKSRVIILLAEDNEEPLSPEKEDLRLAVQKLQDVNPFKTINEPVEWQKQLRDNWERCIIR